MALVRGTKSLFPCPVCLVPAEGMSSGTSGTPRTTENMKKVYHEASGMEPAPREELLKSYSLRYVEVCWVLFYQPTTHYTKHIG